MRGWKTWIVGVALGARLAAETETAPDRLTLESLEARVATENTYPDFKPEFHRDLARFLEAGEPKTGEEFRRVAVLAAPLLPSFRARRMRYELFLTAVAMDDDQARTWLGPVWDELMTACGRPVRICAIPVRAELLADGAVTVEPAPAAPAAPGAMPKCRNSWTPIRRHGRNSGSSPPSR